MFLQVKKDLKNLCLIEKETGCIPLQRKTTKTKNKIGKKSIMEKYKVTTQQQKLYRNKISMPCSDVTYNWDAAVWPLKQQLWMCGRNHAVPAGCSMGSSWPDGLANVALAAVTTDGLTTVALAAEVPWRGVNAAASSASWSAFDTCKIWNYQFL